MMRILNLCMLLLLLTVNADSLSVPISYTLKKDARVSVAIYDVDGRMVRELARAVPQEAGHFTLLWDGLDQAGRVMPRGKYQWRLLQTQELQTEYLFSLGTSFGDQHWPGGHGGPAAVAVSGNEIYMAASSVEGAPQAVRFTCDGVYQHAYPRPEPGAMISAIAVSGEKLYMLCATNGKLFELDKESGVIRRTLNLNLPEFGGIPERLAADAHILLAACQASGKLCWIDPVTGTILASATVEKLADITLLPDGQVFAISGKSVVALTRSHTTARIVVSDLTAPTRLNFDAISGDLFIAEGGDSWQIKRYDKDLKLLATYGRAGGRLQGRYHTEDFLAVTGIAGDGKGGFVVTESGAAPRRTAHFDQHGMLLREWYGGQEDYCAAVPDPGKPDYLWFGAQDGWVVQAEVDYQHRIWHPYATYRYAGWGSDGTTGTGQTPARWSVRHHGKLTYLLRMQGHPCLLRVDEPAGRLVPEIVGIGNSRDNPQAQSLNGQAASGKKPIWDIASSFTFFATFSPDAIKAYKIRTFAPFWQKAMPHYPPIATAPSLVLSADASKLNPAGLPEPIDAYRDEEENYYLILRGGGDGYMASEPYQSPYSHTRQATGSDAIAVMKWDAQGNAMWRTGAHAARVNAPRGQLYAPVHFAGMAHGCIGVCDRIVQPCEFWTEDGLYAGGLFHDSRPLRDYAWWRVQLAAEDDFISNLALIPYDMQSGGILLTRENGEVLFLGPGWNNCPIYRLNGWEHFVRQSGWLRLREESMGANGAGVGLHAAYFAGDDVRTTPVHEETSPVIWFDSQKRWPVLSQLTQSFTTRWSGQVESRFSEDYTLAVFASGGVRLWLDGKLIIDHLEDGGRFFSAPVRFSAGQHYQLRLLFHHSTGTPEAHLCWESLSQPIEHIPACYLYPGVSE